VEVVAGLLLGFLDISFSFFFFLDCSVVIGWLYQFTLEALPVSIVKKSSKLSDHLVFLNLAGEGLCEQKIVEFEVHVAELNAATEAQRMLP
jgi:hypothetical protein